MEIVTQHTWGAHFGFRLDAICTTCGGSGNYNDLFCAGCGASGRESFRERQAICLEHDYRLVQSTLKVYVDRGVEGLTVHSVPWCPVCHKTDWIGESAEMIQKAALDGRREVHFGEHLNLVSIK